MNETKLKERIQLLEQDYELAIAKVNAIQGAINESYYWLEELTKEEESNGSDNKQEPSS